MLSKRKKFWIIFGSICFCVIAIAVVFSFVFRLRTVDIEFRARLDASETRLEDGIKDKVLADGEFLYNANMFFYKTDSCVQKIEKENPYIKVEQVIKYFPNVIRVYISEREMRYRVQDTNDSSKWYILDKEFKVLEQGISSTDIDTKSVYYKRTVEVDPSTLTIHSEKGNFIVGENETSIKNYLNAATEGIYARVTSFEQVSSIKVNKTGEYALEITLSEFGTKILVKGNDDITEKVKHAITVYNADQEPNPDDPDYLKKPYIPNQANTIIVENVNGVIRARIDLKENENNEEA